jgi:hypothetical protein
MSVLTIQAKVSEENVAEVEAAATKMFAAIDAARPEGIRYASGKMPDGVTFLILLELEAEGENPLVTIPEFIEFQENLKTWIAEPPVPAPLEIVGSYRLFS